jgi:hypothetical protein
VPNTYLEINSFKKIGAAARRVEGRAPFGFQPYIYYVLFKYLHFKNTAVQQ